MRSLETRVPPPVVTFVIAGLMLLVSRFTPHLSVSAPHRATFGVAIGVTGLVLELVAAIDFHRVCTTVNPLRPSSATSLVVSGVYRFTRNPIYLGDLLLLLGYAVFLGNLAGLVITPLFVIYINRFQIAPEERILAQKFGADYQAYKARVRRWV